VSDDPSEPSEPSTEHPDLWQILATACHILRLKPLERSVLRNCMWARTQVSNGHFLTPPRTVPSANRLIELGYVAKSPEQPVPFDPKGIGLVVVLEQSHFTKLIEDAKRKSAESLTPTGSK
jgi:hypothetical protein